MILKDILNETKWTNIKASLKSHYSETIGDDLSLYHEVYRNLLKLKPSATDFVISVTEEYDKDIDDKPYMAVSGKDGTLNKDLSDFKNLNKDTESDFANSEVRYSLALTDWKKWIGMVIDDKSLELYNFNDIAAHCLWEMTFYGFDVATINNNKDELIRSVDEIKNMTEEERKEKLIPWEKNLQDFNE